ncbi:MAG TPA: RpiB/LacA/LacB family sugar-phosphate isomerase [Candidatus Omnitrophota bacterium]|nr:RpiB/LacA/LacB family sugar-phosphate isomerase [Candidatus Omnitrophota bacterium]
MKVYIGADHRGVKFKEKIKRILGRLKVDAVDIGAFDHTKSCDYPKIAYRVATCVAKERNGRGILLCMSGIGQAMAANKVPGAYAALCYNVAAAKLSRQHNNSNILVLGAKFVKPKELSRIIKTWLTTEFEGGRHQRRINQIKKIEKGKKLDLK